MSLWLLKRLWVFLHILPELKGLDKQNAKYTAISKFNDAIDSLGLSRDVEDRVYDEAFG